MAAKQYPHQSWMEGCSARTKLTPRHFCFPGTHDTGAYQRPDFTIVADNNAMATSMMRFAPAYQEVATRWALSQPGCRVYEQLMNGVRYLDLRVSYAIDDQTKKWTWYLIHTFVVCRLEDVLDDIARFLASHPSELLIIDVGYYYKASANVPLLQQFFVQKLERFLYPNASQGKITETVDDITRHGKQIIVCLASLAGTAPTARYFYTRDDLLYTGWPFKSIDNVPAKQEYIYQGMLHYEKGPKRLMFQLTYTLTEVAMDVVESLFTGGSLKKYADKMNPTQKSFVFERLNKTQRGYLGIIENDDQVNSCNVEVAMMVLAERVGDKVPVERPLVLAQKQGAPRALTSGTSAWDATTNCHHQKNLPSRNRSTRRRPRRSGCLRRALCCCLCCGSAGKSDSEDEMPLVRH